MDRKQKFHAKESALDAATNKMEEAIASVKSLSKSVKSGTVDKRELEDAIKELKSLARKVEILTAESKMLGGFSAVKEFAPKEEKATNPVWYVAVLASVWFLFLR